MMLYNLYTEGTHSACSYLVGVLPIQLAHLTSRLQVFGFIFNGWLFAK